MTSLRHKEINGAYRDFHKSKICYFAKKKAKKANISDFQELNCDVQTET